MKRKSDAGFFDCITAGRKAWDEMLDKQSDLARSSDHIHPQAVARAVSDLAARDAVFVFDTGLITLWSGNWIRQNGEQRIIGSFNNCAVGTALGQANGVQALDRSRQVIALCGDGGFNMLMCEFLTAVQHKAFCAFWPAGVAVNRSLPSATMVFGETGGRPQSHGSVSTAFAKTKPPNDLGRDAQPTAFVRTR